MAIRKNSTMVYCPMCGFESLSSEFYESTNPHHGYEVDKKGVEVRKGYIPHCKKHLGQIYFEYLKKGNMQSAIYFTCAIADIPFIKEVYDRYMELRKEKIDNGKLTVMQLKTYNDFAHYREQLKSMKKATDSWDNFQATNIDYTTIMGLKKPDIAIEAEKDKFILDWGIQDQIADYDLLDKIFNKYTKGVEFVNAQQEDLYRDLCQDRLSVRKMQENRYKGDETREVVQKRIERLMSKLKIDEFESTKPKSISEQLLFAKIAQIETTKPADLYKDKEKFKDITKLRQYEKDMVLRPLLNTLAGHRDFDINMDDIERYNLDE